ncbi:nitrate/nitrite transporter [Microbacterium sp. ZXX196]|uniref:MFS transporter n=1 Tax=Microbacterium sp. ZXX196 TaxID=2609291 RepID=UPI0012B8A492|nr:MFS transporter [Microbacterium sp. ZXX196]MTE23962.1 MFS transporter [Microbacterium sp. ZXX196]
MTTPTLRPWLRIAVWVVGCVAYLAAIMSRTSLSATGAIASDRFDLTSDNLATFGILQLLVYAGVQIPVGMLIDRLGARAVLLSGLVIVAGSQLLIGFGETFAALLVARAFAGLGDAMIFPSAVRLTAVSLRPAWISTGTQMIGVVGNFGMVVTATPLVWLVAAASWPAGYAVMAAFTGVVALAAGAILSLMGRDPSRTANGESLGSVVRGTGEALREPGTWLAFTTHLITSAAFTAFVVTWGPLFLEHGAGLDAGGVGAYLLVIPLVGMVAGPVFGRATAGRPRLRRAIIAGSVVFQIVAWALALTWPVPTPLPVLGILAVATALGGPASLIAFDLSRHYVPGHLAARANGVVNSGGFTGALLIIWLTGAMLTAQGAVTPDDYTMALFRVAYLPMLAMLAVGLIVFLVLSARIRRSRA